MTGAIPPVAGAASSMAGATPTPAMTCATLAMATRMRPCLDGYRARRDGRGGGERCRDHGGHGARHDRERDRHAAVEAPAVKAPAVEGIAMEEAAVEAPAIEGSAVEGAAMEALPVEGTHVTRIGRALVSCERFLLLLDVDALAPGCRCARYRT